MSKGRPIDKLKQNTALEELRKSLELSDIDDDEIEKKINQELKTLDQSLEMKISLLKSPSEVDKVIMDLARLVSSITELYDIYSTLPHSQLEKLNFITEVDSKITSGNELLTKLSNRRDKLEQDENNKRQEEIKKQQDKEFKQQKAKEIKQKEEKIIQMKNDKTKSYKENILKQLKNELEPQIDKLMGFVFFSHKIIKDFKSAREKRISSSLTLFSNKADDAAMIRKANEFMRLVDSIVNKTVKKEDAFDDLDKLLEVIKKDNFIKYQSNLNKKSGELKTLYDDAHLLDVEMELKKLKPKYECLRTIKTTDNINDIYKERSTFAYGDISKHLCEVEIDKDFINRPLDKFTGKIYEFGDKHPYVLSLNKLDNTEESKLSNKDRENITNLFVDLIRFADRLIYDTNIVNRCLKFDKTKNSESTHLKLRKAILFAYIKKYVIDKKFTNTRVATLLKAVSDAQLELFKEHNLFYSDFQPNTGESNIILDWNRTLASLKVTINGETIQPKEFKDEKELKKFFIENLLKELDKDKQEKACNYLMISCHQGGYLHPVAGVLSEKIPANGWTLKSGEDGHSREINFITSASGFAVEEIVNVKKILLTTDGEIKLESENDIPILSANATINVDLTDPSKPTSSVIDQRITESSKLAETFLKPSSQMSSQADITIKPRR